MSVFRTKRLVTPLILIGLTFPVSAQTYIPAERDASFLPDASDASSTTPAFSGLAAAPPELTPPPSLPEPAETAAPATAVPAAAPAAAPETPPPPPAVAANPVPPPQPAAPSPAPVPSPAPASAALPVAPALVSLQGESGESIGTANPDNLGAAMWKGTPRAAAQRLLSFAMLTASPDLNRLMRRLLATAAIPPEGASDAAQTLTAMRVEKLVTFGDAADAWSLATHADPGLVDDITFHFAAEADLASNPDEVCAALPAVAKTRGGVDWLKSMAVCQLRAKDVAAAQATLDSLRAQPVHDDMFLEVAGRNILGAVPGKSATLPNQLTPLTPPMLALLRLTGLPLPGELYGHPDFALVPALLDAPAKQDVAQLGLAERAAAHGVIGGGELGAVYRRAAFTPQQLIAPLIANESGSRLRALLYQAALPEKDADKRIAYAVRFLQSATPDFLNGGGGAALGDMLGTIKADPSQSENAVALAEIYVLAERGDLALDWLRLAKSSRANAVDLQTLWPQFALAGLETEGDYTAERDQWLDAALKPADPQADMRAARDNAAATLLLLDAAGFAVTDADWVRVLAISRNEKHIALSPVLFTRLREASAAFGKDGGHVAETVLLATAVAGDGDIPLPVSVAIARALRAAGLKSDAGTFARHMVALTVKSN